MTMENKSLYQISVELEPLEKALESLGGEIDGNEELVKLVEGLILKEQQKVDQYGRYALFLKNSIELIKAETKRLKERETVFANKLKRLKDAAKSAMEVRDIKKIAGTLFSLTVCKNGGETPIEVVEEDIERWPTKYVKREASFDMTALRDGLENNDPEAMKIARFIDPGTHIKIS